MMFIGHYYNRLYNSHDLSFFCHMLTLPAAKEHIENVENRSANGGKVLYILPKVAGFVYCFSWAQMPHIPDNF